MKNDINSKINENNVVSGENNTQTTDSMMSYISPEDINKITTLNKELYRLSSEKDALYLKISDIQKNISDIKSKYKTNQNNVNNSANIMESRVRIMHINDYINEDNRPANIIEFSTEEDTEDPTPPTKTNNEDIDISKKQKKDNTQTTIKSSEKDDRVVMDGSAIYVRFKDNDRLVLGKIYKVKETSDWETKVIKGKSDTFEEMAFVKTLGVYGVLDKMEGFYDDVDRVNFEDVDKIISHEKTNESKKSMFSILSYE